MYLLVPTLPACVPIRVKRCTKRKPISYSQTDLNETLRTGEVVTPTLLILRGTRRTFTQQVHASFVEVTRTTCVEEKGLLNYCIFNYQFELCVALSYSIRIMKPFIRPVKSKNERLKLDEFLVG